MTTLATPEDICTCGHLKIWHAYLRPEGVTGEPIVSFFGCGKSECGCEEYREKKK